MFAEVILHRRVPSKFPSFTYEVPKNLSVCAGQLVHVPFRKQKLAGIVCRLHETAPPYPVRPLEAPLNKETATILPAWQISLADWMAKYYNTSFSKVIDFFIPEKIWKPNSRRTPPQNIKSGEFINVKECKELSGLLKAFFGIKSVHVHTAPLLILEKTLLPRRAFYATLKKSLPKDAQALFLFPEIFAVNQFACDEITFHSALNETQKALIWKSVKTGDAKIIAGTRAALFLPFKKLGAVVLDFEENESYREKRQPNYHALEVAGKLAELWKIPLIVISSAPRVETWRKIASGEFEKIEWKKEVEESKVNIIDMKDERRKGITGMFAESVIEKIAAHLSQNKQILLFVNRKGEAGALLCRDCHGISRCGTCGNPMALHRKVAPFGRDIGLASPWLGLEEKLTCHRCRTSKIVPASCPVCSGNKLKPIGAGTEGIEKEISKIFGKAKVLRLDRELLKREKLDEKNLESADIIVATQIIEKPVNLPRLKLTVATAADSLLSFPDFRAQERAFQLLTHLRHLTSGGELIIQTFLPEHSLFQNLQKNLIENFYEDELATRKSLSLPPFKVAPT